MTEARGPYAEVIGDPVVHSKSPLIHRFWLEQLGLAGEYRATRVPATGLPAYFGERRRDPAWCGCNVTIPHKQAVLALMGELDLAAERIGAANCIYKRGGSLVATNSDVDGVAAALRSAPLEGSKAVVIGAGGGARAAVRHLLDRDAGSIVLLVRDTERAKALCADFPHGRIAVRPLERPEHALAGAVVVVNASPMGMDAAGSMPADLLAWVEAHAEGIIMFDMVYAPLETDFLAAARRGGGVPVDGLTMLIGQARAAFELFFGRPAPTGDDEKLRSLLVSENGRVVRNRPKQRDPLTRV